MISTNRAAKSLKLRIQAALDSFEFPQMSQTPNGDEARYADKSGTYTKGLKQDSYGKVNLAAYQSLKKALASSSFADFENIINGGPRKQNGPQGALAFDLEGADSGQFYSPPAPEVASAEYGAELIELYWASLLRDTNFTMLETDKIAAMAADELNKEPNYQGPKSSTGAVTPHVLFRGSFPGELFGPYLSQFFIRPAMLGTQPISQQLQTYPPKTDYMTDIKSWFDVQNGALPPSVTLSVGPRFAITGRDLAAYTHDDVLYQAYFTAFLVLNALKVQPNPGLPYNKSKTENGFGTLGGPDVAGLLGEVATRALKTVWYQKWIVHLRHRPESGGGIVQLIKTGQPIDCTLYNNILSSKALDLINANNKSFLLPQAFAEGSPTHPAYPTGHGTVGGACITILKFFFDGDSPISDPMVPSEDGSKLVKYMGADAGKLTVNGELHKLASNVSFGHGIHAGIHWRSDTYQSILLGEELAIRFLKERALTYNEPLKVTIKRLNNEAVVIENPGNS